jgi:hypothetical protein
MDIVLYFLPAILLLGIITSYEDSKLGKIRNKWVAAAIIYSLVAYGIAFLKGNINGDYIIELITNTCFSIAVGFAFWYFKVWTAGDGKLFIAYSALMHLSVYKYGYQKWIPSVTLLINIFMVGLVSMLIIIIYKSKFRDIMAAFLSFSKKFFQLKSLLNSFIYLFAIFWLVEILFSLAEIQVGYIIRIFVTIFILAILQKKLGKKLSYMINPYILWFF